MNQAVNAYSRVSQAGLPPRELEATALIKAATRLQVIREDWDGKRADLDGALTFNRKLWTILVSSATEDENPLPATVKQSIFNLGTFIFQQTLATIIEPDAGKLGVLVNINREIAAGLRAPTQQAA